MAEYSAIQHESEIQDGPDYVVKAAHLIDNFNAIISALGDLLDPADVDPVTINALITFLSGIKTDTIVERTAGSGVTVGSALLKGGMIKVAGTPDTNGKIGYASNKFKGYINGAVKNFIMSGDVGVSSGFINGYAPRYKNASTITLPAGMKLRDSTDTMDIVIASDTDIDLSASGAGGLDTGSEANSTWYYPYAVLNSTSGAVSAVFSTVNERVTGAITLPGSYNLKAQIPIAARNNGSGNIIPFSILNWPYRPFVFYTNGGTYFEGLTSAVVVGPNNIKNAGTDLSWTSVDASSLIPPISTTGFFEIFQEGSGGQITNIRVPSASFPQMMSHSSGNGVSFGYCQTNSSQAIEYQKALGGGAYIDVFGYVVDKFY